MFNYSPAARYSEENRSECYFMKDAVEPHVLQA